MTGAISYSNNIWSNRGVAGMQSLNRLRLNKMPMFSFQAASQRYEKWETNGKAITLRTETCLQATHNNFSPLPTCHVVITTDHDCHEDDEKDWCEKDNSNTKHNRETNIPAQFMTQFCKNEVAADSFFFSLSMLGLNFPLMFFICSEKSWITSQEYLNADSGVGSESIKVCPRLYLPECYTCFWKCLLYLLSCLKREGLGLWNHYKRPHSCFLQQRPQSIALDYNIIQGTSL